MGIFSLSNSIKLKVNIQEKTDIINEENECSIA